MSSKNPKTSRFSGLVTMGVMMAGLLCQLPAGYSAGFTTNDFGGRTDFTVGGPQEAVATGDLDGDGKPDVAVAVYAGTITIFQNVGATGTIGSNSLGAGFSLGTGDNPVGVVLGDVDGDGKLDIIVANRGGNLTIFRNISSGGVLGTNSFAPLMNYGTPTSELRSLAAADFDGDGHLDVAVLSAGNNRVYVFRNNGVSLMTSSTFSNRFDYPVGAQPFAIAVGDIDGDGKPDLAIANYNSGTVSVMRNTSTVGVLNAGSFAARVDYVVGGNASGIGLGDLDGDGKLDMVVANFANGQLAVFKNTSVSGTINSNSFAARTEYAAGGAAYSPVLKDFDGDGRLDVAIANEGLQAASVFWNSGSGVLTGRVDYPIGGHSRYAVASDLNGDGKADLVVAKTATSTFTILQNKFAPAISCVSVPAGLVGWWKGEGNTQDSADGNNGTAVGSLAYSPAEVGNGFVLTDAGAAGVQVPAASNLNVGLGGGFTVEAWINPSTVSSKLQPIVEWNNSAGSYGVHFYVLYSPNAGTLYASVRDVNGNPHILSSPGTVINAGELQHVALTYDKTSGQGTLYRNGAIVAQSALGSFTPHTSYDLFLGRRSSAGTVSFDGTLDEVSLYSRALSQTELSQIYNAGSAGKCAVVPVAPTITQQPANQTVFEGQTASFTVQANGTSPLSYQWMKGGSDLNGATSSTLTLSNVQTSQSGIYSVRVSNGVGDTTSSNAVLTVNPLVCAPGPTGLVSWWKGEANTLDSVDGNNGVASGALSYTAGEVGQGFSFNGSDASVKIPASANINVGPGTGLTVEMWINPTVVAGANPLFEWNNGTGAPGSHVGEGVGFWLGVVSDPGTGPGSLYANIIEPSLTSHYLSTPAGSVVVGSWQHVALVYDKASGIGRLYLNGAVVNERNLGSFTPQTSYDAYVAYQPFGQLRYTGGMDELAVYNRALSTAEIAAIYSASSLGKCAPTPPPTCSPAASGLVSWWKGEGNTLDSVDGNNGLAVGGLSYAPGEVGQAFTFNGTNAYAKVPSSGSLNVGSGSGLTIETWINPSDIGSGHPLVEWNNATGSPTGEGVHLWISSSSPGDLYVNIPTAGAQVNNTVTTGPGIVKTSVWQHVAVTYDKGSGVSKIYYNGSVVTEGTLGNFTPRTGSGYDLYFGFRATPAFPVHFAGRMDEVGVYSRALASSEIASIYSAGSAGKCAPVPVVPSITQQPADQTVTQGQTVTFTVQATGTSPLAYQWSIGNSEIGGATSSTLTLSNVQVSQAGNYSVRVSNSAGNITSSNATLTVIVPAPVPEITSISPGFGPLGTSVTISGNNFGPTPADNVVYFGGVRAQVSTADSHQLNVTVPIGAGFYPVSVTVGGLSGFSQQPFDVTFAGGGNGFTAGSFGPYAGYLGSAPQEAVAVGDLDGDGKLDVALINYDTGTVSIFRNIGASGIISSNSLSSKLDFSTGGTPMGIVLGDVDGDGKLDVVIANREGTLSVLRNTSTPGIIDSSSFASHVDFALGAGDVRSLVAADFDGDGHLDVAVLSSSSASVLVFRNSGASGVTSATYPASVSFAVGSQPISVAAGDIDGDGKPDLAIANYSSGNISILRNTSSKGVIGSGSFAPKVDYTVGGNPSGVGIGDLNGDGKPEVVVANFGNGNLSVFRNIASSGSIGAGSLAARVDYPAGGGAYSVAIGDLDGDGRPDVAIANDGLQAASVFWNGGSGVLTGRVDFASGGHSRFLTLGDLNGDGRPDLVVAKTATSAFAILQNQLAPATSCVPNVSGLVSWWKGDGDTSDSWDGNNGLPLGGLSYAAGKVGQGFVMSDASATGVKMAATSNLNLGLGAGITIEAWINPSVVTKLEPILEWNNSTGSYGAHFYVVESPNPGTLYTSLRDINGNPHLLYTSSAVINVGQWQHVAVTYNKASGQAVLYKNGQVVAQANMGTFTLHTTYDLFIGRRSSAGPVSFDGMMDEVSIYNRALAASDIASIYQAGTFGKCVPPPVAPSITQQPANQTVVEGQTASFTVQATGTSPLAYQWMKGGSDIGGATGSTLTLSNVQTSQAGNYSVRVSNGVGNTTSSNAVLIVNPLVCTPEPAGLVSWWQGEGNTFDSIDGNNGVAAGNLTYAAGKVGQGFNFNGTDTSVKIPASGNMNVGVGSGLTVEMWINPTVVAGANPLLEWNNGTGTPGSHVGEGVGFWLGVVSDPGTGPGSLYANVIEPSLTSHYLSTPAGSVVIGAWQHVALVYDKSSGVGRLYLNGAIVNERNLGSFTPQTSYDAYVGYRPTSAQARYTGAMDELAVYNRALSTAEIAAIYSAGSLGKCPPAPSAPSITQQPTSRTVNEGSGTTFSVGASGSQPLAFQWQFNGNNLAGATQSSLTLSNISLAQAGGYSVVVTNNYGSVTSLVATLTVNRLHILEISSTPAQTEGTVVTLPIRLISTGDVAGITFKVLYNTTYLKNPELDWDHAVKDAFTDLNVSTPGEVRGTLAMPGTAIQSGTQSIAQLSFFIRSVPNSLSTPLTMQILDMSGDQGQVLGGTLARSSQVDITVRGIVGDNNANNRLDVGDATAILRYLASLEPIRPWDIPLNDLNQSGGLDSGDAIKVLRVAAKIDPQPAGASFGGSVKLVATGLPGAILYPTAITSTPGSSVTVQVRLQNQSAPVSGAALTVAYDTNALRLVDSGSYHSGSMVPGGTLGVWNVSPSTADLSVQAGRVSVALSSANPWSASNGVLAELTFVVQPGANAQYLWPITLSSVETTEDGYFNHQLVSASTTVSVRAPVAATLAPSAAFVDGKFSLTVNGDSGASYAVEASTDLKTWVPVTTVVPVNGSANVTDPDSGGSGQRFYRVKVGP